MHFEFLIEDLSGAKAMSILAPKLIGSENTFRLHSYRGVGRISNSSKPTTAANKRILLDQLPKLLRGYGNTPNSGYVVVICDLDNNDKNLFLTKLRSMLNACNKKPNVCFCLAIEEFEAWYLGDFEAVRKAYPKVKDSVLNNYKNDAICDTWEVLADAVYPGGRRELKKKKWSEIGEQKSIWAEEISPHMDVNNNRSPSFNDMYAQLKDALTSTNNITKDIAHG